MDACVTKTCKDCGETKLLDDFHNSSGKKYGKATYCKPCASARSSQWYSQNTERARSRITAYSHAYIPKHDRNRLSRLKNLLTKARLRKNREYDPSLTPEYLEEMWVLQNGQCALSGMPLVIEANQTATVSLDRIDSSKGYVRDNLQLVSATVNRMKQELPEQAFIQLCGQIADFRRKTTR